MLPPILEIYTVWHPLDREGEQIAQDFFDHFHGTLYSGLLGGAVETYQRSVPWSSTSSAPRPIIFDNASSMFGISPAEIIVIIPILGMSLAREVEPGSGQWFGYLNEIIERHRANPKHIFVMPIAIDHSCDSDTVLGKMFSSDLRIGTSTDSRKESPALARCRDVTQAIAQLAGDGKRIKVFISHTKRSEYGQEDTVTELIESVRRIIAGTRLTTFFDSQDLQVGTDWATTLVLEASHGAVIALRTDLYASREWCQKEIRVSKNAGMPVVILEALMGTEQRGSFLMDHVPRVAAHQVNGGWNEEQIRRALALLVDECLKRILWKRQEQAAIRAGTPVQVSWWAPHAPEPLTFSEWLANGGRGKVTPDNALRILHPDPPLGRDELEVLDQLRALAKLTVTLDVLTPRMLAVRGV